MYIDVILLVICAIIVIMFFKRFSSFVFFIAIVDIFLRILTFIKNNIGLQDVADIIGKYLPENIIEIINKYTGNWELVNTILQWAYVIIMCIFLGYIIKIFIKKKKI